MERKVKILIVALLASVLLVRSVRPAAEVLPIGLASLGSGDLAILDAARGVFVLSPSTGRLRSLGGGFGAFRGIDLTTGKLGDREVIFVTIVSDFRTQGETRRLFRLVGIDLTGKRISEWNASGPVSGFSGVAIDPTRRRAFIVNSVSREIDTVSLDVPARPALFVSVRGAQSLGPLTLDASMDRLLVGDSLLGAVFEVDLKSRRTEKLVEGTGACSALAVDSAGRRVFIADPIRNRIWVASIAGPAVKARNFADIPELREPLGLALGANGDLWVASMRNRTVVRLGRDGKIVRSYKLLFG